MKFRRTLPVLLLKYLAWVISYSILRIPLAALAYGFFQRPGQPDTVSYIMRYPDMIMYAPFTLLVKAARAIDHTSWGPYLLATYDVALVLVLVTTLIVVVTRTTYAVLRALLVKD